MIIECKNCLKKFTVRDGDIPMQGRTVQCGSCSAQWLQMPIAPSVTTSNLNIDEVEQDLSKNEFIASDGKNYRFLGNQWAEVLPLGKAGKLARKKISKELNKLAGRKQVKKNKTVQESKQSVNQHQEKQDQELKQSVNQYQEKQDQESKQSVNQYQEKQDNGMGIFSFLMLSVISVAAIILLLDTFKHQLISVFPNLDNYLVYIFETLNNIYVIIKDLFNNYK